MGQNHVRSKQPNLSKLRNTRQKFFDKYWDYKRVYFERAPYDVLKNIIYTYRPGMSKDNDSYNEVIIMFDTETSKKTDKKISDIFKGQNHVCAWTVSIRSFGHNIMTIWGRKPSDLIATLEKIHNSMEGDRTVYYVHNLPYDWYFIRKFAFKIWGNPVKQLNVKQYYPIYIQFENGIIFRDSLILSQCSLEKWAQDMQVEHGKAVGKWNYEKYRNQMYAFSRNELDYMECDTLSGVECIDKLMQTLGKRIYSMPWTATGIVREACRIEGKKNRAHEDFLKIAGSYEVQLLLEEIFHGGYTHGDRHYYGQVIRTCDGWGVVNAYDFASSYTASALLNKFPMERFTPLEGIYNINDILENSEDTAFIFELTLVNVELKSSKIPMPYLQHSKCRKVINPVLDNGRIVQAQLVTILLNEIDLSIIAGQYKMTADIVTNVYRAHKDYLPKWYTDFGYNLFKEKTKLKGVDKVRYTIAKAKLNAGSYGMTVQRPCKDEILEEYEYNPDKLLYHTTEFVHEDGTEMSEEEIYNIHKEEYDKYVQKRNSILPYQWGVWITSLSARALFRLASCIDYKNGGKWLYSDTDSIYCVGMDPEKLNAYNDNIIVSLKARGYDGVLHNGRLYYPGIAEHVPEDDEYTEFCYMGAKRYAGRHLHDNELVITVAGVPKKTGKKCLMDDIDNFKEGFIFSGIITGKKTHTHYIVPDIYIDEDGNETGDSIDLSPCDYLLAKTDYEDFDPFNQIEEVYIQTYDEE